MGVGSFSFAEIRELLLHEGAVAVGAAVAAPVDDADWDFFMRWLAHGRNAGMEYMRNYPEIRRDPRFLLDAGASTVISIAFSYNPAVKRDPALPRIAEYALFRDYHKWIRSRIRRSGVGEILGEEGKDWRICVDSAPILERYWARRCGIAFQGRHGAVIVPGVGAKVLLAEIVTTAGCDDMDSCRNPLPASCGDCMACRRACPTGALHDEQGIDCNICLSYLTIEHRGEVTDVRQLNALSSEAGRDTLFGCDRCICACVHDNPEVKCPEPEIEHILHLDAERLRNADREEYRRLTAGTPLSRRK